jgi:hypothetical protein
VTPTYAAVSLYGAATGDKVLESFGRVLLEMEIRSTRFYWHMTVPHRPSACLTLDPFRRVCAQHDLRWLGLAERDERLRPDLLREQDGGGGGRSRCRVPHLVRGEP